MILNAKSVVFRWLVIFASGLILAGCGASEDGPVANNDSKGCSTEQTQLFGTWIIDGLTIEPSVDLGNGPVTDLYAEWDPCRQDDREQLLSNGNYLAYEGDVFCNDTLDKTGTWDFDPQNCKINISVKDGSSTVWNVTSVSDTELQVTVSVMVNGKHHVQTRTYRKY